MMTAKKTIKICIASPGDIILERKIVREVCSGINDGILPNDYGVEFNVTKWENSLPADTTSQGLISNLAAEYDIFVCIFHQKTATFSDQKASDAMAAFLSAYDSWKSLEKPYMLFFFKSDNASPEEKPQSKTVQALKEKVRNNDNIIYNEFSAPYEFCEKIHDRLEKYVSSLH